MVKKGSFGRVIPFILLDTLETTSGDCTRKAYKSAL